MSRRDWPHPQYPHAFSGWSYPSVPTPDGGFQWTSKAAHAWSYRIIDFVLWHTFLPVFNELRARCQLRTLRLGFAGSTIIRDQRVPFSQMWSPSLCPRPADWPSQVHAQLSHPPDCVRVCVRAVPLLALSDRVRPSLPLADSLRMSPPAQVNVAGFFFWDQKAREVDESSAEYAPVCAWLAQGEAPIYIGFGSMVFDGPSTTRIVVEAARRSGKRVLMQTSTAGGTLGVDASELPPNVFAIGRCSHDWLLPKMAAVIHHGGAGTTGAGLRLALPSMCCPFFGDQFFYGHCIAANGCGPYPIAFTEMSVDKLSAAFEAILEPRYADGARRMAARIESENGLEVGLSDFNRQLPLADMVCDVSTLLGERGVGRVYYPALRLKVSDEVDATLRTSVGVDMRLLEGARPHVSKQWHLGSHVRDPCTGLCAGALAFVWELADAIISVVVLPIRAACHNGVAGFLMGILAALLLLVARVVYAPIIAFDRVATGVVNCVCTPKRGERHRPLDHVVDPEPALTRIGQVPRGREPLCGTPLVRCDAGHADGASRWPLHGAVESAEGERRAAIEAAFTRVVALRRAFDALDAGTNDDALSLSEVATLEPAWRPGVVGEPPAPADMPFSADRRPALAEEIGRYMSKHRKSHLQFAEFVLLSREVTPLA